MAKKSQRSKAKKNARKVEDLPARQKAKNVKGGRLTESWQLHYEKLKF